MGTGARSIPAWRILVVFSAALMLITAQLRATPDQSAPAAAGAVADTCCCDDAPDTSMADRGTRGGHQTPPCCPDDCPCDPGRCPHSAGSAPMMPAAATGLLIHADATRRLAMLADERPEAVWLGVPLQPPIH